MGLIKKVVLSLFLVIFYSPVFAGTIKGIATDKQSGEPLIGAVVTLDGSGKGTATGMDGTFEFKNVADGKHTIAISYVGYKNESKDIEIHGNEVYKTGFAIENNSTLKEITIRGAKNQGSDETARQNEKNSDNLMNIVSARTIELSPDITVANVLQRVSGVQMQRDANGEARYAIIRGMDQRYNYTTVNDVKIASPDDKMRYVPLDIFPAELVDRVEVIKTLTPSMEGDAIGGVVNLAMKDAPDHMILFASGATGYNETLFDRSFNQFSSSAIAKSDPAAINGPNYSAAVKDFPLGSSDVKHVQAPPNGTFNLTIGNRFLKDKKLGVIFSGSYQNTYKSTDDIFFKPAAQPTVLNNVANIPQFDDIYLRNYSTREARTGLHTKIDYRINSRNTIELYGMFINLKQLEDRYTTDSVVSVDRTSPGIGTVDFKDRTALRTEQIYNVTLKGKHQIADKLTIDWTGAYSQAIRDVPDMTEVSSKTNISEDSSGARVQTPVYLSGVSKSWEKTTDQDYSGYLNITYASTVFGKDFELKAGGMYRSKDRTNYYNTYSLNNVSNNIIYNGVPGIADSSLYVSNPQGQPANWLSYKVHENISAYYLQGKLHLMNNKLEVIGGVRVENTYEHYTVNEDASEYDGVVGTFQYTDVLPSLNLKYALSPKENLRFSYYESISRPGFFEVIPYRFSGEDFDEWGNDSLRHTVAQNFDVRYEWFPKGIDQLLVGAFYKNIDDPIEYLLARNTGPSAQQISPQNIPGSNAINYGAEIQITKFIHSFGLSANYTYTHSAINTPKLSYIANPNGKGDTSITVNEVRPLQGQAAHVANMALIYRNQDKGFNAHLTWTYTGRHIVLLSQYAGLDYWQKGTSFFAFSCEKTITKRLTCYAKINNLLNSSVIVEMMYPKTQFTDPKQPAYQLPYQTLSDGNTLVEKSTYGRNYLIGIRYKID